MDEAQAAITFGVGVGGVVLGAFLARRNERRATADRLLTEAMNDAFGAIAEVATARGSNDQAAQARYGSAAARIALHAPKEVVVAFRRFQDAPTTETEDGRTRLLAAVQEARCALGHEAADDPDLYVLMFGSDRLRSPRSEIRP